MSTSWAKSTAILHAGAKKAWGEAFTYAHAGGGSSSIVAVFDTEHVEVDPETGAHVTSSTPNLGVELADLSSPPADGDTVTRDADGQRWLVLESQIDGQGWATLILQETE